MNLKNNNNKDNKMNHDFQKAVDNYLIRHRSVLDVISKFQETCARSNRAIIKSVTNCGCLKISASKQKIPEDIRLADSKKYMSSHLTGEICHKCKEVLESELGSNLFYLVGICEILGLDFHEIIKKETERISTLGVYSLT